MRRPCCTSAKKSERGQPMAIPWPWTLPWTLWRAPTSAPPAAPAPLPCWPLPNTGACGMARGCRREKKSVGPAARGAVDREAPVKQNLKAIARRLQRGVDDLVVVVLDRPRHQKLIADIREAGSRIRLISDGDLSA